MEGLLCRGRNSVCVCVNLCACMCQCVLKSTLCSRFLWRLPLASVLVYQTMVSFSLACVLHVSVCIGKGWYVSVSWKKGSMDEHRLTVRQLSLYSRWETVRSHASQTHTLTHTHTQSVKPGLQTKISVRLLYKSQYFLPLIWWCDRFLISKDWSLQACFFPLTTKLHPLFWMCLLPLQTSVDFHLFDINIHY